MSQHVVIIGSGQGGMQTCMSLRQQGHTGKITMIGAEPGLPYQRPPLSKAYLKGGDARKLILRPESFFIDKEVDLISGVHVDAIDRSNKTVALDNEQHIGYDKLVIATGSRNFIPPITGVEHCLGIRTLKDAERLRSELTRPRKIAVIGGGFIGLEFAAVALEAGHEVSIAEASSRLMSRAISPEMSALFLEKHESLGASIHLNSIATEVTAEGVHLNDGSRIEADLVILGVGIVPNVELAQTAGLAVDNGIVVDEFLLTDDPDIHAIGDCARFPEAHTGELVRLESVQATTDHARFVSQQILSVQTGPYSATPWFWSDQSDWKLQIVGLAKPGDESVQIGEHAIYRFNGERLSAIETINDARTHMLGRKLLGREHPPSRNDIVAANYDLKLLSEQT